MPRRGRVPKRDILPDPVYGSKVVAKLINQVMLDGEKSVAQRIVYDAFSFMGEKLEIRPERRQTLAIRWIVLNTRKRSEREMSKKLAAELMDAYNNTGGSVKKKEEMHRMAEANKAFAHFRF